MQSFIPFNAPFKKNPMTWNKVTFYNMKVISLLEKEYKAGKRLSIEISAPNFLKKYYLFCWNDSPAYEAIKKFGLRKDDIISCHTVLNYYKVQSSRTQEENENYQEAYQIVPNWDFNSAAETEENFHFMYVKREEQKNMNKSSYLSTNDLLKKIL